MSDALEPLSSHPIGPAADRLQAALDAARDAARDAHAPETLRAYAHDWRAFTLWCRDHGTVPLPAAPAEVAAWLFELSTTYSRAALQRRLAAIGYQHRMRNLDWSAGHPAIRTTLRAIGRRNTRRPMQAAALTSAELIRLVGTGTDLVDLRDRALLLLGFAGALRRAELVTLTTRDVVETSTGLRLVIRRSKTDAAGEGAELAIPRGRRAATCPVRALSLWRTDAAIDSGALFRSINRWGQVGRDALHPDAVRQILRKRATAADLEIPVGERLSPHGLRAGFVTEAYRANARDEQIMAHTRHRDLRTMRRYVRRARLDLDSAARLLDL